jgi:hypothetical protein
MATYIPLYNLPVQFMDNSGDPLSSGTLEFYLAGTTTTTELFSDSSGTSIGTSITLNSWGMPESGGTTVTLFRDQSKAIKVVGKTSASVTIFTSDNIPAVASFDSTSNSKLDGVEALADVTDATNVTAAGAYMVDGSAALTDDFDMGNNTLFLMSTNAGLTASTTQTQADGLALTATVNEVSTVATTNDTVVLPAAAAGRIIYIFNNGANTLQIFPAASDAIDQGTADVAVTLAAGSKVTYVAYNTVYWETF